MSDAPRKVWVCESGEYEDRGIDFVCSSVESGVAHLKAMYLAPYVVTWGDLVEEVWGDKGQYRTFKIVGHFEAVSRYSIRHNCEYEFEEHEVF